MAINLQKGQKVNLTKENPEMTKILVGLGWDPVNSGGGGFLGALFGMNTPDIDCDVSVLMLDANEKLQNIDDIVYFGNLRSRCGSVQHTGDNLTGAGEGDDEQILVNLDKVPTYIQKLVFVVNIYDCVKKRQHFGMIRNAFIRIVNPRNKRELLYYNLSDDYSRRTCLFAGEIHRCGIGWEFTAIGNATNAASLGEVVRSFSY